MGDEHINSRIISALKTNTTSHVIGLLFDKPLPISRESTVIKIALDNPKISFYGSRSAVIGRNFGEWQLKSEPSKEDTINVSLYFYEDAYDSLTEELKTEKKGEEKWSGTGEFILPDFGKLVQFLNEMIYENEIRKFSDHGQR